MADTHDVTIASDDTGPTPETDPKAPAGATEDLKSKYESLSQSYEELRKQVSARGFGKPKADSEEKDAPSPDDAPPTDPDAPPSEGDADISIPAPKAPQNLLAPFMDEFAESGKLSDKSFEDLEKLGVPRLQAETIVNSLIQADEAAVNKVYQAAGGEEALNEMRRWASTGLSEPERDWFNSQANSGDAVKAQAAVEWLGNKYRRSGKATPKVSLEGVTAPQANDVYESMAQALVEMKDPRYKTDPAYRARIEAKMKRSPSMRMGR